MSDSFQISANLVDLHVGGIYPATVDVAAGKIRRVRRESAARQTYLLPGLIDAHVHIESSMLVPSEFARAAVVHGTVATVSDPHEIGNVLGMEGVYYMLDNARQVPFKFFFGAPSCVPATPFETAGDRITVDEVRQLLSDERILYLSEMMNFPGVLSGDAEVLAKIAAAFERDKPVDGHAPGLRGADAKRYVEAGITTDHECFTKEEAAEKISYGAKIAIREGSAARNFDALHTLIDEYPDACMLCSDDKHPDELLLGHINGLVKRSMERGLDRMNVLRAACVNPVLHYGLDVGLLREGDDADFIEVDDLDALNVLRTYIRGTLVAQNGETTIARVEPPIVNRFSCQKTTADQFQVRADSARVRVIEAVDGQLITRLKVVEAGVRDGMVVADPDRDILKLVVVNRYATAPPAVALIHNMGLKQGAIASSVAHDSHNIVAVGASDKDIAEAVNLVIEARGGLSVAAGPDRHVLPLPIAGLMSPETCASVGTDYAQLDRLVKRLGSKLRAPFMTLSFMALLVIPELKLSDQGLFDGNRFEFLSLFEAK